jgi:aspartate aminotransferase
MTARAAALKAQGRDVITLSQGELDFDTPAPIRAAAIRAIDSGKTLYTAVAGVTPLRAAISDKLKNDYSLEYDVEQITVGCGAKQVLFNALLASLDPGDEVIVPTPCWVSYPQMVRLAGGSPVLIECSQQAGFELSANALQRGDSLLRPT